MPRGATYGSIATFIVLGLVSAPSNAGWHEFVERSSRDWHRANAWPQPFIEHDRIATCSPFVIMAQNGWVQQCTLTSFHFDPLSNVLTEAGRLKVQQIVTENPNPFRTVYLVPGTRPELTEQRLQAVRDVIQLIGEGNDAEVRLTTIAPRGMNADEVEAISARLRATMPDPRLPSPQAAGGSTP